MKHVFRTGLPSMVGLLAVATALAQNPAPTTKPIVLDRTSLPIREPARPFYKELDVRNATPPARFEVKAPKGAPNVVIVLIDDMGFGASEAFGGPIPMPTLNRYTTVF